jgi:hypothetical protein
MERLLELLKSSWYSMYLVYFGCLIIYSIGIYLNSFFHSGGEQVIMIGIARLLFFLPIGIALIAIGNIVIPWYRKRIILILNGIILFICLVFLYQKHVIMTPKFYESYEKSYDERGKVEKISIFHWDNDILYSITYKINDLKDSVWTYYNSKGQITRIQNYSRDSLVRDTIP